MGAVNVENDFHSWHAEILIPAEKMIKIKNFVLGTRKYYLDRCNNRLRRLAEEIRESEGQPGEIRSSKVG